jgi:hypothetical protein
VLGARRPVAEGPLCNRACADSGRGAGAPRRTASAGAPSRTATAGAPRLTATAGAPRLTATATVGLSRRRPRASVPDRAMEVRGGDETAAGKGWGGVDRGIERSKPAQHDNPVAASDARSYYAREHAQYDRAAHSHSAVTCYARKSGVQPESDPSAAKLAGAEKTPPTNGPRHRATTTASDPQPGAVDSRSSRYNRQPAPRDGVRMPDEMLVCSPDELGSPSLCPRRDLGEVRSGF